jgi:hypothetical protein
MQGALKPLLIISVGISYFCSLFIYLYFTCHGSFGLKPILDIGIVNINMYTLPNTYHYVYAVESILDT